MILPEVMRDLAALGTEQTRRTLVRHGAMTDPGRKLPSC